jgi:hypothetical protein
MGVEFALESVEKRIERAFGARRSDQNFLDSYFSEAVEIFRGSAGGARIPSRQPPPSVHRPSKPT